MFSNDLGIDLGTANTVIFVKGKGIVLDEPSVVAIDTNSNEVLAVGEEALGMIGRTPRHIVAMRPLKNGVIADYEATRVMLKYFINKVKSKARIVTRPRVLICVPTGVTDVEKRAVMEATQTSGAGVGYVYLIEESMAAAIGAGLPIERATGSMVVDIGGGTSEVAVLSLAGIVTSRSLDMAGEELDEAVITYVKREYGIAIGERTAEELKKSIGCVSNTDSKEEREIRGRDVITGLPRNFTISAEEAAQAIAEPVSAIVDAVKFTLEKTPPELSADIIEYGIVLTGGGALLKGLDELVVKETGISVKIADDPLYCVVNGTGMVLQHLKHLKNVLTTSKTLKV